MNPRRPRILVYSHDTYGLGHLRRSLLVASRLAAGPLRPAVLIATGSARAHAFELPPGCDVLKLPSVVKGPDGGYHARTLDLPLEDVLRLRGELIVQAAGSFRPDLVLVDHAPAGVEGELQPLFRAVQRMERRPRLVLGLRDVIDDAARVRSEWDRLGVWPLLSGVYDRILVYGDRSVLTTADELGLPSRFPGKVRFTGYLARSLRRGLPDGDRDDIPRIVVTAGGGGDGQELLRAWAAFLESLDAPAPFLSTVVAGPFLSRRRLLEITSRLRQGGHPVEIVTFTDRMEELLTDASAVVGMAGYNTVMEILAAGAPALLLPRSRPRLEQTLRAERLAAAAPALSWCPGDEATPARIRTFVDRALATGAAPAAGRLDLGGLDRIEAEFEEILGADSRHAAVPVPARAAT